MTMMISNLPRDLVEEIISRVPLTCIKAVRCTCRNWNALTKNQSFAIKHIGKAAREKEFLMITRDSRVDLISAKLHGIDKNIDLFMKRKGKLVSQDNSGQVSIIDHVLYCNGLLALLCTTINFDNVLVVWNPYWGKTRWIKRPKCYIDRFAFGYDKSCGSHKILNICNLNNEIYDLNSSSSWRVLDTTLDKNIALSAKYSVSLQGNTYWIARDDEQQEGYYFLVCFDFTRERFGPRLPLSFHCDNVAYVSLSTVREEKLAVLLHRCDDFEIEIWVTSKIEPDSVSWSCFLKVEIMRICVRSLYGNFFIEEEKKVAVIFYETYSISNSCCIIGENGFFRRVDLRNFPYLQIQVRRSLCSYAPTSVQI